MSDIDPRRTYIIQFRRSLRLWKEKNLSHQICVRQATLSAKRLYPLTEAERKDVDTFLAKEIEDKDAWQSMEASHAIHIDYEIE
jgi:hypothetical protein